MEIAAARAKMEAAGPALWDPEVSARRNVRLVRSGHDVWGVKKCVMIFCDDFIQSVYVLPYWSEWGPLIEPIFRAIGVPTRRVVRCLLAAARFFAAALAAFLRASTALVRLAYGYALMGDHKS